MQQVQTVGSASLTARPTDVGVSESLIDAKILALADYILPDRIGSRLIAHLLGFAVLSPNATKQYSLLEEVSDEAILEVKSVGELATSPGSPCAVESYSKSLLVLEALEVIRRAFLGRGKTKRTQIRIRLAAWEISVPAILARLEKLRTEYTNKKVQQIARRAIKRLKSGEFLNAFGFTAKAETLPGELEPAKQLLQNFARDYGIEAPVAALHQVTRMIAAALLPEKYALDGKRKGEFLAGAPTSVAKKGRVSCKKGEFLGDTEEIAPEKGVFHGGEGEFLEDLEAKQGEFLARKTPEFGVLVAANTPLAPQKGEFLEAIARKTPDSGETGRVSDQKGVFHGPLSVIGNSSSEITVMDTPITDAPAGENRPGSEKGDFSGQTYRDPRPDAEIRGEAQEYAELIDEKNAHQWLLLWIKRTRNFTPQVRRWAAIDTFYHTHCSRTTDTPGRWFNGACERFTANPEKVSPLVKDWAASEYRLKQIKEALRAGYQTPASLADPLLTTSSHQLVASEPLPGWVTQNPDTTMTREQAEALREQALQDGKTAGENITAEVRQCPGGWYVATRWDGIPVEHYTVQEWHTYFTDALKGLELKRLISQRK